MVFLFQMKKRPAMSYGGNGNEPQKGLTPKRMRSQAVKVITTSHQQAVKVITTSHQQALCSFPFRKHYKTQMTRS